MKLRVLIGCEYSGVVRNAFRARGHDAWSCDVLPSEDASPHHYQCDVRTVMGGGWDLVGFHPPCTYLCSSGLHWNHRRPGRAAKTEEAIAFVRELMACPSPWYLENPTGCISTRIRKPDQSIQPFQFGEDASKKTCLWLNRLPPLFPTRRFAGRLVTHAGRIVERWSNQTDGGQNRLPPSQDRWKDRSRTYQGIADAMADQWTTHLCHD